MKLKSNKAKQKMGYRTLVLISPVGRSAKEEKVPEPGTGKDRPKATGTTHSKLRTATEKEAGKGPPTMCLRGAALRSGPLWHPRQLVAWDGDYKVRESADSWASCHLIQPDDCLASYS